MAGFSTGCIHPGTDHQPAEGFMHQHSLACLFISHDLSVVEHIADRVGIMYLGTIVEIGFKGRGFQKTLPSYTKVLISAVPVPDPTIRKHASF
jgi:ABC-type oligopeptide transport system ATPase subunit